MQVSSRLAATPADAADQRGPLDAALDPTIFRALGDPSRARLFGCLVKCGRPCTVGELAECCAVDLSVVSRHLALLAEAGILRSTRHGRSVVYAVRTQSLARRFRALADGLLACGTGCTPGACELGGPPTSGASRRSSVRRPTRASPRRSGGSS